jgi:hypothetical protein
VSRQAKIWKDAPVAEDFLAAQNFLLLIAAPARVTRLVAALRRAKTVEHTAKDLLRASRLPLLPRDEAHVKADLKRIHKGKALSPVLVIQGNLSHDAPLVVADGYHRICAVCYYDEDAPIACRRIPAAG